MGRDRLFRTTAIAVGAALAGAAHADFFSFASDMNPNGPTFSGPPTLPPGIGFFTDGQHMNIDHMVMVDLLWDADEDGPGGPVAIPAMFSFRANFNTYNMFPVAGSFVHAYTANGFADFVDPQTFERILRINFNNALFTSWSNSPGLWGETATLQDHEGTDPNIVFLTGGPLAGRDLSMSEDFGFTLTAMETMDGGRVPIAPDGSILDTWMSEGSFSAHATPAPGALALAALGAVSVLRRRRSN